LVPESVSHRRPPHHSFPTGQQQQCILIGFWISPLYRRAKEKNLAKRREAADKGDGSGDAGPSKAESDDELDGIDDSPQAATSPTILGHDSGSATPPPSSAQPSPLDALRPPHAFPLPLQTSGDLYALRRGSLPLSGFPGASPPPPALPPSAYAAAGPLSPGLADSASRRRSVDASLVRLASHPYAHVARSANGTLYGPRASVASGQLPPGFAEQIQQAASVPPTGRVHPHGPMGAIGMGMGMGMGMHAAGFRPRPSLAHRASMPQGLNGAGPGPIRGQQTSAASRTRLLDDRLYAVSARTVSQPLPGPLPSPTYSFGASAAGGEQPPHLQMPQVPSGDLDQQLHAFQFPPPHHDDGSGSSNAASATTPNGDNQSTPGSAPSTAVSAPGAGYEYQFDTRFNSIASIAESEASSVGYSIPSEASPPTGGLPSAAASAPELALLDARRASVVSVHDAWGAAPMPVSTMGGAMGYDPDVRKDSW
jgi:hypothetical protein